MAYRRRLPPTGTRRKCYNAENPFCRGHALKRFGLVLLCLFAAGAFAGSGEKLTVPPYPGKPAWKNITDKGNAQQHLREWIPSNQTEATIRDILTEQIFYAARGADPAAFVRNFLIGAARACDRVRVNGPTRQTQNGYAVAYAQVYCVHQRGTPFDVDIFLKAIGGKDALYVVQREFRRPMQPGAAPGVVAFPKDQMAQMKARLAAQAAADKFLASAVQLCPPKGCPQEAAH